MTALNNNKETSINPMIIMDKAIDMSTRLSGSQFPVSIFPAKIQRIIKEVHECHSFPTDYISAAILTALAVGIGNTHLAQMKQGWLESPILYMALIGKPGANKSHPLSFAMKPFLVKLTECHIVSSITLLDEQSQCQASVLVVWQRAFLVVDADS
jgi:hypothetical protein